MASYFNCIVDAREAGEIDDDTADLLFARFGDAFEGARSNGAGPDTAERQASQKTQAGAEKDAFEADRRAVLADRVWKRLLADNEKYKLKRGYTLGPSGGRGGGSRGGLPPIMLMPPKSGPFRGGAATAHALDLLMSNKAGLSGGPFASVEDAYHTAVGAMHALLNDAVGKFATRTGLDSPNRAVLKNVVRELHGEDTRSPEAKALAAGMRTAMEYARKEFNRAGGAIAERADWALPQPHDSAAVYDAGPDKWIEFVLPLLKRSAMIDDATGVPFGDNSIRQVLRDVWGSITEHGLLKRTPGDRMGIGATGAQRMDERFLVFDGADKYMQYQDQFGRSDAYDAVMSHLDGMAKDIAEMQILGPNPDAMFNRLKDLAVLEAAHEHTMGHADANKTAQYRLGRAQAMWDSLTGVANVPDRPIVAKSMANIRGVLRSAELGSAVATDMPSAPFFGTMARMFAGAPLHGDLAQFVKLLASPAYRHEAGALGFINESATDALISTARDQLQIQTVGGKAGDITNALARKLPSATLRLSGLTPLFEMRKASFRMTMTRMLHNAKGMTLAQLDQSGGQNRRLAIELGARGITNDDWNAIRATPSWKTSDGHEFLRPSDIAEHAGTMLGVRVGGMIANLERLAVPVSGSVRSRTLLRGNNKPGSLYGEAILGGGMFKTFVLNAPMSYSEEIAHRALGMAEAAGVDPNSRAGSGIFAAGRFGGLAALVPALTIAGAVTLQLKQIAGGKDPLFMGTPKFWGAAALQGGSFGILGDFFYSSHSRFGHTLGFTGAGPVLDAANDVFDATWGEGEDLFDRATNPAHAGKPDKEVGRILNIARKDTPILSSLIWAKMAYQRGFVDQMQKALDPDADTAFNRQKERMMKENGQSAFWPSGSATPVRWPDPSTAWTPPEMRDH